MAREKTIKPTCTRGKAPKFTGTITVALLGFEERPDIQRKSKADAAAAGHEGNLITAHKYLKDKILKVDLKRLDGGEEFKSVQDLEESGFEGHTILMDVYNYLLLGALYADLMPEEAESSEGNA